VGFEDAGNDSGDAIHHGGSPSAGTGELGRVEIGGQNPVRGDIRGAFHLICVHR